MVQSRQLIIYTDLDGSLLDHETYRWAEAKEALEQIKQRRIPLVLCSSKTFAELQPLVMELDLHHPLIYENGCGLAIPQGYFKGRITVSTQEPVYIKYKLGTDLETIHASLKKINQQQSFKYQLFTQLTNKQVSKITGLTLQQAELARQRCASEPLLWKDSDKALQKFQALLSQENLTILSGGRFHTVVGDCNKGRAIEWLQQQFQQQSSAKQFITIALGDGKNDIDMLTRVNHPVLINNPHTDQTSIEKLTGIHKTELTGPAAWNKAVLNLIEFIERN